MDDCMQQLKHAGGVDGLGWRRNREGGDKRDRVVGEVVGRWRNNWNTRLLLGGVGAVKRRWKDVGRKGEIRGRVKEKEERK